MNGREPGAVQVLPVSGLPEVNAGARIGELVTGAVELRDGDVVVITQKIVSKAEGRIVDLARLDLRDVVEGEAVRVLRRRGDLVIAETRHGFVCANAGVDRSNVVAGTAALLPRDSDRSAARIRDEIAAVVGATVGVIVSDTFGRPWRRGVVDVAIGCAGVAGVVDLRGSVDALGRELEVTEVAVVDELAAAAELVMGKARSVPVAIIRGVPQEWLRSGSVRAEVIRPPGEDLFR